MNDPRGGPGRQPRPVEEELGGPAASELLARMAGRLRQARKILLTAHVNPDGDALGSELALARGLRRMGKDVRVVNDRPPAERYRFLDPAGAVEVVREKPPAGAFAGMDLAVLLDTSEPARTGHLEEEFFRAGLERICLDHHPGPGRPLFALHWVAPRAPATASLVLRLLDELEVTLDREVAEPLFVALATDTGWFRFANTTGLALRDAARLVEAGAETESLHARIYEDHSPARMALLGRILQELRIDLEGRFIASVLDRAMLERSGVPLEDLDGFSETLKSIQGAEVTALLVEVAPGQFKVSLRSRGKTSVNEIAAGLGGGGHDKAAGLRIAGRAEEVLARVRARVAEALAAETGQSASGGERAQ